MIGRYKCGECLRTCRTYEAVKKEYVPKKRRPQTRRISGKQEAANAKMIGGRTTIASGSTPIDKGDVKSSDVREEDKYTKHRSYSLKLEELKKIEATCRGDQIPVFMVELDRFGPERRQYAVIPAEWFWQLLETHRDQNDS